MFLLSDFPSVQHTGCRLLTPPSRTPTLSRLSPSLLCLDTGQFLLHLLTALLRLQTRLGWLWLSSCWKLSLNWWLHAGRTQLYIVHFVCELSSQFAGALPLILHKYQLHNKSHVPSNYKVLKFRGCQNVAIDVVQCALYAFCMGMINWTSAKTYFLNIRTEAKSKRHRLLGFSLYRWLGQNKS